MPIYLYCKRCGEDYQAVDEIPNVCPECKRPTKWSTFPPAASVPPKAPYKTSQNDRVFLRSVRIDPTE